MQLTLVHDQKIEKFCYWENGIRQAMQFENKFYGHVASVRQEKRMEAYALSDALIEAGSAVCLTVSPEGYSVWQNQELSR